MELTLIQKIIIWALPTLFAITIHEVAHGWVASKLGDKTAQILGRLTINPIKHIDIIGTVIIPLVLLWIGGFIFGWAKPVPINPQNLKHPQRDMAIVAIAGPLSNLFMAIIWATIMKIGIILTHHELSWALPIILMGHAGISINLVLMVLNLIPIPPLDGSRVIAALLPNRIAYHYERIESYGLLLLLILLALGIFNWIFGPTLSYLQHLLFLLFRIF